MKSEPIVHFGCRALRSSKGRINEEAAKQATTDAMTKALSYIGFSGDVFMGKFDDNKYVAQQSAKFEAQATAPTGEQVSAHADLVASIWAVASPTELEALRPRLSEAKGSLPHRWCENSWTYTSNGTTRSKRETPNEHLYLLWKSNQGS